MSDSVLSAQEEKIARIVLGQIFQDDVEFETSIATAKAVAAGKTFGQGLGIKEDDLEVILGLAASRYLAARYEDAARLYSFAALLNHFDTRAMHGAAMALQKIGNHEAALQYFAAVLLQEPENMEITTQVAESLAMSGNKQEALNLLRKIIKKEASNQQSQSNNSFAERASGLISLITNDSESTHN
jgi:tetratricopeptide (TPR) repeat protein